MCYCNRYRLELRGRQKVTIKDYVAKIRRFQDYHDKPADEMREAEIGAFLHHLLIEKCDTAATVN